MIMISLKLTNRVATKRINKTNPNFSVLWISLIKSYPETNSMLFKMLLNRLHDSGQLQTQYLSFSNSNLTDITS